MPGDSSVTGERMYVAFKASTRKRRAAYGLVLRETPPLTRRNPTYIAQHDAEYPTHELTPYLEQDVSST